jgi:hypothetical protein
VNKNNLISRQNQIRDFFVHISQRFTEVVPLSLQLPARTCVAAPLLSQLSLHPFKLI